MAIINNPMDSAAELTKQAASIIGIFKANATAKAEGQIQLDEIATQGQIQEILAQIAADASSQTAVNATMQAETKSVGWFDRDWRAVWGYLSALAFFSFVAAILFAMIHTVVQNPSDIGAVGAAVSQMVSVMTPVWAVPLTVLGVTTLFKGKAEVATASQGAAGNPAH